MRIIHVWSTHFLLVLAVLFSQIFIPTQVALAESSQAAQLTVASDLVISAVQVTGGTNHTQEDFIELYNPTSSSIDLKGYRLVKRTSTSAVDSLIKSWTTSTIVQPYHFYLWSNSSFSNIVSDSSSTSTLADNNGVALRFGSNDTGNLVDNLSWGNTVNGFEISGYVFVNPGANLSLVRSNLFGKVSNFELLASNPRGSSSELLPPVQEVLSQTNTEQNSPEPNNSEEPSPDSTPVSNTGEQNPDIQNEEKQTPELVITEVLPNPAGTDSGSEKIEIYNPTTEEVNLDGFILDDISPNETLTSNSYTLEDQAISPDSYEVITLPEDTFALNNTGGDIVTLLSPEKEIVDSVVYNESAPEDLSYTDFDDSWEWATSTMGESNGEPELSEQESVQDDQNVDEVIEEDKEDAVFYDQSGVVISEIYPNPESGETEFVEFYNSGDDTADLSQITFWVGEKHKNLPDIKLEKGSYYVLITGLPAQLRNTGQIVKILSNGKSLDEVTYPEAPKGSSFSRFENEFQWTTQLTKGKTNELKIPEPILKEAKVKQEEAKKSITSKTTKSTPKKSVSTKAVKVSKPVDSKIVSTAKQSSSVENNNKANKPSQSSKKDSFGKIVAMGAAAVAAGLGALYKLVFTGKLE